MTKLTVWAPAVRTVEVALADSRLPMRREELGWWSAELPGDAPAEYSFVLDGDTPPIPDPRSASQPRGVHGTSRLVDHPGFLWTDSGWRAPPLSAAILYELHIGTFTAAGTFEAAIERIPHLVELGVTHVEVMPVAEFPGDWGWGYDGVSLYAPHHSYGGPEGLKKLVDALHAHGLAAILDVVYNHLGPCGNYLGRYGPYFTDRLKTPWGNAVNWNGAGSDQVRQFFIDNAVMWLRDYHFDGLRLDAVHALLDTSAVHFLEQLAARVKRLEAETGRHLVLIAESDLNDPRLLRPPGLGGYGLTAQWNDDFHHALHAVLTGERGGYYADFGTLGQLAKALEKGFVYDGGYSVFRCCSHGRPFEGQAGEQLIGYLQNHDQIGNRARGERIGALVNTARLKIGAALVLAGPFIPLLFQGEEWAASTPFPYFTNHHDPELGRAVSEGRRREFAEFEWDLESIPDPQAPATFQASKLDWGELEQPAHREILDWHCQLIRLRKSMPELRWAETRVRFDEEDGFLQMDRGRLSVLCNLGERSLSLPRNGRHPRMLSGAVVVCEDDILLPPDSLAILAAS